MTGIRSTDDSLIIDKRPKPARYPSTSRAYSVAHPRLMSSGTTSDNPATRRNGASAVANLSAAYVEQRKRASKAT